MLAREGRVESLVNRNFIGDKYISLWTSSRRLVKDFGLTFAMRKVVHGKVWCAKVDKLCYPGKINRLRF